MYKVLKEYKDQEKIYNIYNNKILKYSKDNSNNNQFNNRYNNNREIKQKLIQIIFIRLNKVNNIQDNNKNSL